MRTAEILGNVRVLGSLSPELLDQLAGEADELDFRAGDWIIREGEVADSMFIVQSGRVDVIAEGAPDTVIRMLRRGDALGELALLREGTRSASARARRDSKLLKLTRTEFEALIQEAPSFALGLTRALGEQLAASKAPLAIPAPPRTIAVLGLDPGAPVSEVAALLTRALAGHGETVELREGGLAAIDQAERQAEKVVLRGGTDPSSEWTALCLREAELVLAVTTEMPVPAWLERARALAGCELLVLGPPIDAGTVELLAPRGVQVIAQPDRRRGAIEALARRLAGRSVGLVLSGGGARALAHLGVIEELRAAGVQIERVGGVSLGSLVAAGTAAEYSSEAMYEAFERNCIATSPSNDFVPPAYSLLRGGKARRIIDDAFGDRRIEELPLRFFCLSCDLIGRETVVHHTGRLREALYASFAIPGVFPPIATADGRLLVDGAVMDNLPVAAMARSGEGPVIAVDVTGRMGQVTGSGRPRLAAVGRSVRQALTGSDAEIPRLGETILRTIAVGSTDTVVAARQHANLVITPEVDGIGLMDWKALPRARELGRTAARAVLNANSALTTTLGL
jgi:NTE family protein